MKSRIMYIECKGNEISGPAPIGRVTFSKSDKSLYYKGRRFHTLSGSGFKANYFDWESEEHYWVSGCKKRGADCLYAGTIEIDDDIREEYWNEAVDCLNRKAKSSFAAQESTAETARSPNCPAMGASLVTAFERSRPHGRIQ